MAYAVRRARPSEYALLPDIERGASTLFTAIDWLQLTDGEPSSVEFIEAIARSGAVLVATADDVPVGFALVGFLDRALHIHELLAVDEARKHIAAMLSGLDVRYDLGEGHPLLGRRMPDLDLRTASGPTRVYALLHEARPVLLSLGALDGFDISPWASRIRVVEASHDGALELPVLGEVATPRAALIRPDGHVAWTGDLTDPTLPDSAHHVVRRGIGAVNRGRQGAAQPSRHGWSFSGFLTAQICLIRAPDMAKAYTVTTTPSSCPINPGWPLTTVSCMVMPGFRRARLM